MFLIIGEFRHERNQFQISSNTEREAYISFLSSCLLDFFFVYVYQRRFSSAYISNGYICHLTYNPLEEPLVMLLWLFSRFCCTLLLILSSNHSVQNRQENHDINNFLPKFFISHDVSKRLSKLSSLPSMLLCFLKEKSISGTLSWCLKQSDWFAFNTTIKLIMR